MDKIWKVTECREQELEKLLNTLSKSHEVYAIFAHGITVTVVAFQVAKKEPSPGLQPRKKNAQ